MGDAGRDFVADVARLTRMARVDLAVRGCINGLFFGLLLGLAVALLAGSITLPWPGAALAGLGAGLGLAAGFVVGLLRPQDPKRLLIHADLVLGSKELVGTAYELARAGGQGRFDRAVVEDASHLLQRTHPRAILGRRRLRLAPFAAAAAIATAALLVFPVNLGQLFAGPRSSEAQMARLGDELREGGERLGQVQQGKGLDRTIELSRELAQLGKDMLAKKITPQEALERMSRLESGLQKEYQLRLEQLAPAPSVPPVPGTGGPGGSPADGSKAGAKDQGKTGSGALNEDSRAKDLADALGKVRKAQRELENQGDQKQGQEEAQNIDPTGALPKGSQSPSEQPPDLQKRGGQRGAGSVQGGTDSGSDSGEEPRDSDNSGIGTLPAPEKRGPPSAIVQGDKGPNLQAEGEAGPGDTTRLLARALPEWTGSRLPEDTVLNQYSRRAESALARDEVPLKLRQSVKEYFTVIGITK
ncbi:MAG TPA: hypothetical protein VL354_19750 [Spirochaetia bacterium]|nr:hypothetical protein [Spirochaetia bacterium]